jgi:hypothetical protein
MWLGVALTGDPEFTPRVELTASPYAIRAAVADSVVGGSGGSGADADWTIDGTNIYRVSGNVGIGTSNPVSKLSLGTGINPKKFALWDGTDDFYGLGIDFGRVTLYTNNTEKMTVKDNGNVGIGTPAPATLLDIWGPQNGPVLHRLNQQGSRFWNGLRLDRNETERWFVGMDPYTDYLLFRMTGTANAVELDTLGNMELLGDLVVGNKVGIPVRNDLISLDLAGEANVRIKATSDDFGLLVDAMGTSGSEIGLHTAASKYASLAKNAYFTGAWQRFDTGSGAFLEEAGPDGTVRFKTAPAGANPIAWTASLTLKTDGTAEVPVLRITGGSDIAEPFDIAESVKIEPGTVVSIDPSRPGGLKIADRAYDRCVAGIVSGAGGVSPGMVMGQAGTLADGTHPVAMTGRVYCLVDAAGGAVEPGDLLTTSETPGHAMKVTAHGRAQGAIIGKAMSTLAEGRGLVLVLVSLQ